MSGYDIALNRKKTDPLNIMLDHIAGQSTVLEFGCANGRMTQYMSETLGCTVDIIEYNKDLYDIAIKYANDGICGDICDFGWCQKFAGKKYDYIILADVLEHLSNPLKVLAECKNFLKDNGVIWISVPNIAHNDVIVNLMEDTFEYRETGLLDSTHIHFFTKETAKEMFEQAGLYVAYEDGICVKTFCSELLLNQQPEWKDYYSELLKRENGDLYQCVFALTLSKEVELGIRDNSYLEQQKSIYERRIYFDLGQGFQNEMVSYEKSSDTQLSIELSIPENAQMIWVCPAFRKQFIIKELRIEADGRAIDYCKICADKLGEEYYFQDLEGSIYIDDIKGCSKLVITGQIILDVDLRKEQYVKELKEELGLLQNKNSELWALVEKRDVQLHELEETLLHKEEALRKSEEALYQKEQVLNQQTTELFKRSEQQTLQEELLKIREETIRHKDSCIEELEADRQRLAAHITQMEQTRVWKMRTFFATLYKKCIGEKQKGEKREESR